VQLTTTRVLRLASTIELSSVRKSSDKSSTALSSASPKRPPAKRRAWQAGAAAGRGPPLAGQIPAAQRRYPEPAAAPRRVWGGRKSIVGPHEQATPVGGRQEVWPPCHPQRRSARRGTGSPGSRRDRIGARPPLRDQPANYLTGKSGCMSARRRRCLRNVAEAIRVVDYFTLQPLSWKPVNLSDPSRLMPAGVRKDFGYEKNVSSSCGHHWCSRCSRDCECGQRPDIPWPGAGLSAAAPERRRLARNAHLRSGCSAAKRLLQPRPSGPSTRCALMQRGV
jgi:hypothetical protein